MVKNKTKTRISWKTRMKMRRVELEKMYSTKSYVHKKELANKNRNYLIHHNGGRPFKVTANKNGIFIYELTKYKEKKVRGNRNQFTHMVN
jgi:hypothetical protein